MTVDPVVAGGFVAFWGSALTYIYFRSRQAREASEREFREQEAKLERMKKNHADKLKAEERGY